MALVPIDLTRLLSQLNVSGLSQKDQPLYQVIKQLIEYLRQTQIGFADQIANLPAGGGGGGGGVTGLVGDVVAGPGVGVLPSVIQPNVVTYGKIQKVVNGQRLLGSEFPVQDVIELALGANLQITGGVLDIETPGGGTGLLHDLLSPTHPDTLPASPVHGDLIRAIGAGEFGEYVNAVIMAPVVEAEIGVFCAMYPPATFVPGNNGSSFRTPFTFVVPEIPKVWLAYQYIDAFINGLVIEDFSGIKVGMGAGAPLVGNYMGMMPVLVDYIPVPNPAEAPVTALWQRIGIGAEGEVLTVIDGKPEWSAGGVCEIPVVCPWVSVPFNAGDFTATGGVTPAWAVDLADVIRWEYQVFTTEGDLNNSVRIAIYLRNTSVSGSAPNQLRINLPFNILGAYAQYISLQENLAAVNNAFVAYDVALSPNTLFIQKVPFGGVGPPFDTTANATYLSFEISAKTTLEGCFHECSGGGGSGGGEGPAVPLAHAVTHETGGTDPILHLSGGVIDSGTVADGRLSSNVALVNNNNNFSIEQKLLSGLRVEGVTITNITQNIVSATPSISLLETGAPVDLRRWRMLGFNQLLIFDNLNDAATVPGNSPLILNRGGDIAVFQDIYQKSRSVPVGNWQNHAFNASDFTADVGTWTVIAGDVVTNTYTRIGKTLIWSIGIAGSSTLSTNCSFLFIKLPGGITSPSPSGAGAVKPGLLYNNAAYHADFVTVLNTADKVVSHRGGGTIFAGITHIYFTITLEVND